MSRSSYEKENLGKRYVDCLLLLLDPPFTQGANAWVAAAVAARPDSNGAYAPVADLLNRLLKMAKDGDPWQGDESLYGSPNPPLVCNHLQEIEMYLRPAFNRVRGIKLVKGHFRLYPAFEETKKLLIAKLVQSKTLTGDEAKQRRKTGALESASPLQCLYRL